MQLAGLTTASLERRIVSKSPDEPKVGDQHAAVGGDQCVVGLDVPVDQTRAVHRREPACELLERTQDLAAGSLRAFKPTSEGRTLDQLHHQIYRFADNTDVKDRNDVGVGQASEGTRLRLELSLVRTADAGPHQLDRDTSVQLWVFRTVDDTHPALADPLSNPVASQHLPIPNRSAFLAPGRGGRSTRPS